MYVRKFFLFQFFFFLTICSLYVCISFFETRGVFTFTTAVCSGRGDPPETLNGRSVLQGEDRNQDLPLPSPYALTAELSGPFVLCMYVCMYVHTYVCMYGRAEELERDRVADPRDRVRLVLVGGSLQFTCYYSVCFYFSDLVAYTSRFVRVILARGPR